MKFLRVNSVVLFFLMSCSCVFAKLEMPALFCDGMVIQQKSKVAFWGWAEPGQRVDVKCDWHWFGKSCKADQDGQWRIDIKSPSGGGPFEIVIKAGDEKKVIKDVLSGEVWLASGQSNMMFPLYMSQRGSEEIASANYPEIRFFGKRYFEEPVFEAFGVEHNISLTPQTRLNGKWEECKSENAREYSAVAYFFAREIHKKLGVPVGIISSTWGGTPAESWMSRPVLESDADYKMILARIENAIKAYPQVKKKYENDLADWKEECEVAKNQGKGLPTKPYLPFGPEHPSCPSGLYNGMISPIVPYTIQGVVWYQGESNAHRAYQYQKLFPDMIRQWRNEWGDEFDFYYVQIAPLNYYPECEVPELQEAQSMALSLPKTAMVVTNDIGNLEDIHPQNKQDVGKRLALCALAKKYGMKDIVYSGPKFATMSIEGDKARLCFDNVNDGFVVNEKGLSDFQIAGEDHKFYPAEAVVDGNQIVVFSDKVKKPKAVRYGWRNDFVGNLSNKAGLPASSFRTDDWPGVTYNRK